MRERIKAWLKARPRLWRQTVRLAAPLVALSSVAGPHPVAGARSVSLADLFRRSGPGIGRAAVGRHIVMLIVSDFSHDPRLRHSALALAEAGYRVTVIVPQDPAAARAAPVWHPAISFQILPWQAGAFAAVPPGFLATALLAAALEHRPLAFHAHDLTTGLAAMAAARRTGAHLVVDFHEWMSEGAVVGADGVCRPVGGALAGVRRRLEKRLVQEAGLAITVCPPLAEAMGRAADRPSLAVIRNMPDPATVAMPPAPDLRAQLDLPEGAALILYQGGIGPTRNLEPVIRALAHAPSCHLAIRGRGLEAFADGYRAIAREAGVQDRLHFLMAVAPEEVVAACNGADAGLYTVLGMCENARLAAPNKLFEYLAAGLPVLSADYPGVGPLVRETGIGELFNPDDPRDIGRAMIRLLADPAHAAACRARARPTYEAAVSEGSEWAKLVALYRTLPARPEAGTRGAS